MIKTASSKRHSTGGSNGNPKKRSANSGGSQNRQIQTPDLWFGFTIMEEIARGAEQTAQSHNSTQTNEGLGVSPKEALELETTTISFARVPQRVWPYTRSDNIPGQQYHITQISFGIQIDPDTGFARTYKILLHFEKPLKGYTSAEITQLTAARLEHMKIQVGDILEPIAPLCNAKASKAWNGLIKLYLKAPNIDGYQLLTGRRVSALLLDGELRVAKVAKGYAATAYNDQLTVRIEGAALKGEARPNILVEIVEESFKRGHEIKVTQIHKTVDENRAYLIAATPEQRQKLLLLQVSFAGKMITPTLMMQQNWTRKEIAKKNCLTLITKNLNITYLQSEVNEALQKLMGSKNVVTTYFPKGSTERNQHDGICNLEVINPVVYKQYERKTIKLLHTYMKFIPHPRSLDETSPPTEELLSGTRNSALGR
jgi:hypothetical protein